jgi:hypothetical protein
MVPVNRLIYLYLTVNLFDGHIKSLTNELILTFLINHDIRKYVKIFVLTRYMNDCVVGNRKLCKMYEYRRQTRALYCKVMDNK